MGPSPGVRVNYGGSAGALTAMPKKTGRKLRPKSGHNWPADPATGIGSFS